MSPPANEKGGGDCKNVLSRKQTPPTRKGKSRYSKGGGKGEKRTSAITKGDGLTRGEREMPQAEHINPFLIPSNCLAKGAWGRFGKGGFLSGLIRRSQWGQTMWAGRKEQGLFGGCERVCYS